MRNDVKAMGVISLLAVVVALTMSWVDTYTVLNGSLVSVFIIVHLPLIAAGTIRILDSEANHILSNLPADGVARLFVLTAPVGHVAATLAYRSREAGDLSWSVGYWVTWLLCIAAIIVTFGAGRIGFLSPPPSSVSPDGQPVSQGWVAVAPGTLSSAGVEIPAGEWLRVAARGATSVSLVAEDGRTFEVPASTVFIYPEN